MKKILIFIFVSIVFSITSAFGQLRVANNGNVAIKVNTSITPLSTLSIGEAGDTNSEVSLTRITSSSTIHTKIGGLRATSWDFAYWGFNNSNSALFHVGLWGTTGPSTPTSSGRSFGVLGGASNSTSGYNYGVFGTIAGSNNGAGIVGTTGGELSVYVPGMYAGYFLGNVRATGTITAQSLTSSDSRLKENVLPLSKKDTKFINSVMSMNPVEYNLKQVYVESAGDTTRVQTKLYDEKSQQFKKKHFGLIAQELKEIYPDLVYEEDDGYLTIDYTSLIPILIQSIKELKSEIDDLRSEQLANRTGTSGNYNAPIEEGALLTSYCQDNESPLTGKNED